AVPFGGSEVGITPAASFAEVTDASTIFEVVTELSASLVVLTAALPIVGLGYVPERSPPALPFGGNELGINSAAIFEAVIDPSITFEVAIELSASLIVVTAALPMVGFGYVPERSPPAGPPIAPVLSIPGAHCVPLNFKTWPVVGIVLFSA